ncbi:MAG: hypothetical protein ABIG43_04840 [Chloroflexota bacterium]
MYAPFIPGKTQPNPAPLERFLPPIPAGMSQNWAMGHFPEGAWVLDPFGNNPQTAIELARAGYRVLVTANNPIHSFMLQILTSAPSEPELTAALSKLGDAQIAKQGYIEPYIRSLYKTTCINCDTVIEAQSFIWRREEEHPYACTAHCPNCGINGEQALPINAHQPLNSLPPIELHRARALERIVSLDDPCRKQVENALNCYQPRPLIILQTLINKIITMSHFDRLQQLLTALLLSACDQGNTLWAYPTARSRPLQLAIPAIYQEFNLWETLSDAIKLWQTNQEPVSLVHWPEAPPLSGGISLFNGRLRELAPEPPSGMIQGIITAVPRPNQAFWTLSALWTGWLWGKDSVAPLKVALSRQRYDWNWHTNALYSVFLSLNKRLPKTTPFLMIIPENEHDFLSASMHAAGSAGFKLKSIALSGDGETAQCYWSNAASPAKKPALAKRQLCAQTAVKEYLAQRFEPSPYQWLHAAVLAEYGAKDILGNAPNKGEDLSLTELYRQIDQIFLEPDFLIRYGGGPASLDTGLYWLKRDPAYQPTLIDQVEFNIIQYLQKNPTTSLAEIKATIYQACQGLLTPDDELIMACLNAYADPITPERSSWQLRHGENPETRSSDIQEIYEILLSIADDLDFRAKEEGKRLIWYENKDQPAYTFFISTTAIISKYIFEQNDTAKHRIILLPGSRANLLAYKLKRDPRLKNALDESWLCVKFRQLRNIRDNPLLSRKLWESQIKEDPPEYQASQMALF